MDRDRGTDGQRQVNKQKGTVTQKDTDGDTDTGMDNFNGKLTKELSVKNVKFSKILQN
jgi:hypothetical protein